MLEFGLLAENIYCTGRFATISPCVPALLRTLRIAARYD